MEKRKWGTGRMRKNGYDYIKMPNHPNASKGGYILEHRYIMEQFLGRLLHPTMEKIHHINGNRLDNRLENLIVMNQRAHTRLHKSSGVEWKFLENEQWLRKQYVDFNKTPNQISKEIRCCHQAVRNALARFKIREIPNRRPRPPIKYPQLHDKKWLENASETMSQKQIAETLGCRSALVCTYQNKHGIKKRFKHISTSC